MTTRAGIGGQVIKVEVATNEEGDSSTAEITIKLPNGRDIDIGLTYNDGGLDIQVAHGFDIWFQKGVVLS